MQDIMKDAYDQCPIGGTKIVSPDPSRGHTLEEFQAVVSAANYLQEQGLVFIKNLHRETQSGDALVDIITFKRIR